MIKTIYRIARLELSVMFYSPIAWLLLLIFTVQTGMSFTRRLNYALGMQDAGYEGHKAVTTSVFSESYALFHTVQYDLYLYIPLLTMGLISRELHSGSIKLLMSSPVRISEIVFGKYLAMMIYCLLLALVLVATVFTGAAALEAPDYPAVITAILGIYLLACSYAAIGLFMSTLTSYQVVAAISTFAVFGMFLFLGSVGQTLPVIRDLTYWLSVLGRADNFRVGMVASKHTCYFFAVIALFLSFSILKLSQGRRLESTAVKASRYLAVVLAVFLFGYITSTPGLTRYWDMTRIKSQTLAEESVDIITQITGPWKITTFVNVLDGYAFYGMPEVRKFDYDRFERYLRYNPQLEMEYVLYYDTTTNERLYQQNPGKSDEQLAREFAKQQGLDFAEILSPAEMRAILDLESEQYRLVRRVEWNGRTATIRAYKDQLRLAAEKEISAALKRLLIGPAKVAVVTGHGERSAVLKGAGDYQKILTEVTFRGAMISHGFDIVELSLDRAVPETVDILIVADPRTAYTATERQHLQDYITAGGNLLIAGEPDSRAIINPLLENLGVTLAPTQAFQHHEAFPSDVIFAGFAAAAARYTFAPARHRDTDPVVLTGTAPLEVRGLPHSTDGAFEVAPILVTGQDTSSVLALALTRQIPGQQDEQRIMIVGDADFMSIAELSRKEEDLRTNNSAFIEQLFRWLSNGRYPVVTERADFPDKRVLIDRRGITWVKIFFYGIVPVLLILCAATLLIRRRQK